jgi:membrane fusion protein (multidrug efflux system)
VQLDPADASLALDRARAELARAVRQVRQLRDTAGLDDAYAEARRLELEQAQEALLRRLPLRDSHAIAPESLSDASRRVAVAKAALLAAQRQAHAAHDVAGEGEIRNHPSVQAAQASYVDAWLWLQRTRIVAPLAGTVAQRTVQPGERVQAGAALMRVIPADQMWIDANLKEGQLRNLRIGQAATVEVDVYGGGAAFEGRVAGFSPGTGSAFALLPTQNAAGNWVKVVQRVPVRIELRPEDLADRPLLIGLSSHVRIDTHDHSGPRLTTTGSPPPGVMPQGQDLSAAQQEADRIVAANLGDSALP